MTITPPIWTTARQLLIALAISSAVACGQDHNHHEHHNSSPKYKPEPPKIFLDKSPRVVAYQLKRLDNQRLLMVERKNSDIKYVPVYEAILTRSGMTPEYRKEATAALATLQKTDASSVLLKGIESLATSKAEEKKTAEQLIEMLIEEPANGLKQSETALQALTTSPKEYARIASFSALLATGEGPQCFAKAEKSSESLISLLHAFSFAIDPMIKDPLLEKLTEILSSEQPAAVKKAAVRAISTITAKPTYRFNFLVPLLDDPELRGAAVRAILTIAVEDRNATRNGEIAEKLVAYAEGTPAEKRTTNEFTDAMQLADQVLSKSEPSMAKAYRQRLGAVTVRMIRIRTVEEEMRYDVPYFVVQAGKPIQIILENHDLMPHNLVISNPGTLKKVAQEGLSAGPKGGSSGLAYVPDSEDVLFATDLVPSDSQTRLTFDAPTKPGEYPYVCTFPQHWYRMYGVMVVVEDLDQWMTNPSEPSNPIGNNRSFVQAWTVEDLESDLASGLKGRTEAIGRRLFDEASCRGCHRLGGEGGVVGPDLAKVVNKWKGNQTELLREILEPSHRVDEAYQMQKVLTVDGQTLTGIRVGEDDEKVLLITNPESNEPITLLKDDIEIMAPSSTSMMPKALLDQYTKDEIFEIIAYIESAQEG